MGASAATALRDTGRRRARSLLDNDWFTAAAAAAVALALGWVIVDEPARTDLAVANPTALEVGVTVVGDDGDVRRLATLEGGTARVIEDVIAEGGTWTFRFDRWGQHLGELGVVQPQLEAAGWSIEIPAVVGQQVEAAEGVAPGPLTRP